MPESMPPPTPTKPDSPWHFPKPNPGAFASVGKLARKHESIHERLSLPIVLTTPGTPKSKRSKFVLPAQLSPFPLSPNTIKVPLGSAKAKFSSSFYASSTPLRQGLSSDQLVFETVDTITKSTKSPSRPSWERSLSPMPSCSLLRESDLFEMTSSLSVDDDVSLDVSEMDFEASASCDISPDMLKPLPWKSPIVNFLTQEYFERGQPSLANLELEQHENDSEQFTDYFTSTFDVVESFGDGSFSNVFKALDKENGRAYAIKRSKTSFSGMVDRERRLHEIQNLLRVRDCIHCIRLESAWEQNGFLYIQTEICENGTLKDVVEYMASTDAKFTEFQIWNILRQLSLVPPLRSHSRVESHLVLPQGILHIHEAEIAHLDLKPANIFICANGMLKIGDFGLSTRAGFVHDADSEGDKVYMAPEVLEGCFGKAADIFSLGLVTLELAADVVLPGEGPSWFALRHSDLSEIIFEDISSDLICLIRDMLEPNPSKRPDISHVLQRISRIFQPPHTS